MANFTMDSAYLLTISQKIKDDLSYMEVLYDSTWYRLDLASKRVLANGKVEAIAISNISATNLAPQLKLKKQMEHLLVHTTNR